MLIPPVDLEWRDTELVLDERVVKGAPDVPPDGGLGTRIRLGIPVCRSMLDVATDLAAADPGFTYTLVELGATFSPAHGERILQAWLMATLSVPGAEGGPAAQVSSPAIAWSMTPDRLSTPLSQSLGVEVSADFQIFSVGLNRNRSTEGSEIWLEALNIRCHDPVWEFTQTSTTRVYGGHTLNLMVRSPAGTPVQGRLSLLATVQRRRLKVLPYRILLGDSDDAGAFEVSRG